MKIEGIEIKKGILMGGERVVPESYVVDLALQISRTTGNLDPAVVLLQAREIYQRQGTRIVSEAEWQGLLIWLHDFLFYDVCA